MTPIEWSSTALCIVLGALYIRATYRRQQAEKKLTQVEHSFNIAQSRIADLHIIDAKVDPSQATKMEALEREIRSTQIIISGLTHNINNALTPIRGLAELLAEEAAPEKSAQYGRKIVESTTAVQNTTQKIRRYICQRTLTLEPLDLHRFFNEDLLPFLLKHAPKPTYFRCEIAVNTMVQADCRELHQVLTYLLLTIALPHLDNDSICFQSQDQGDAIELRIIFEGPLTHWPYYETVVHHACEHLATMHLGDFHAEKTTHRQILILHLPRAFVSANKQNLQIQAKDFTNFRPEDFSHDISPLA